MTRALFILLLLLFSSQLASSQAFEPGYLVLQSGDTLRGELENRFWEEPPKEVRYRAKATDAPIPFTDGQLRSVVLNSGRILQNETLPIDRNAETRVDYLPVKVVRKQLPEAVLADVLLRGPASLLGITLHATKHFFVQRPGQPYLELAANNYLVLQNGVDHIADANDFKSQLLRYFGDCEAATSLLPTTAFTAEGLRRVVQAFNQQCSGVPQAGPELTADAVDPHRPRIACRLGLLVGARYNSLRLQGPNQATALLNGLNIDGRLHAQAGGYLDLLSPGRRLAVHLAGTVSRFGNPQPVAFAQPAGTLPGSFEWRGTMLAGQLGLRGFIPLASGFHLLVGGGYEANGFWKSASRFTYGSQQGTFIHGFDGTAAPYGEVGLARDRLALILTGRVYQADYVIHYLPTPNSIESVYYTYQPWSLSLALSYRLNGDSDKLKSTAR